MIESNKSRYVEDIRVKQMAFDELTLRYEEFQEKVLSSNTESSIKHECSV